MSDWTPEQLAAMGYELDNEHPANLGQRDKLNRQIDSNAARRESGLPCAGSAGEPLAPGEPVTPHSEVDRLCRDPEKWARVQELRQLLG